MPTTWQITKQKTFEFLSCSNSFMWFIHRICITALCGRVCPGNFPQVVQLNHLFVFSVVACCPTCWVRGRYSHLRTESSKPVMPSMSSLFSSRLVCPGRDGTERRGNKHQHEKTRKIATQKSGMSWKAIRIKMIIKIVLNVLQKHFDK